MSNHEPPESQKPKEHQETTDQKAARSKKSEEASPDGASTSLAGSWSPVTKIISDNNAAIKKAIGGLSLDLYGGGGLLGDSLKKATFGSIIGNSLPGIIWPQENQMTEAVRKMIDQNQSRDLELDSEVRSLRKKAREQTDKIREQAEDHAKNKETIENLKKTVARLDKIQEIQYLLNSVSPRAASKIYEDKEFRNKFTSNSQTFVVSIDIRRSTELMLKARTPKDFAEFVTTLCGDLIDILKGNLGVVDKFTGDGILAFFPLFFTGEDAGYFAMKSATEANAAFRKRYKEFRSSFSVILDEVGLGIGIDYGEVQLVQVTGALTIVGAPVVYACRMGGAPAGCIYLNQGAYDEMDKRYPHLIQTKETTLLIKGDGALLAYDVSLNERIHKPNLPEWLESPKWDIQDSSSTNVDESSEKP